MANRTKASEQLTEFSQAKKVGIWLWVTWFLARAGRVLQNVHSDQSWLGMDWYGLGKIGFIL